MCIAVLTQGDIALFVLALLAVTGALVAYFVHSYWRVSHRRDVSPYTGLPLRHAKELTFATQEKITQYLRDLKDFDNRPFNFSYAAFCRETGRIFPDAVTLTGAIKLDWTFIIKRYRGDFVSWGSLSEQQQKEIKEAHHSLSGFQVDYSSANPSPRLVEEKMAVAKPGPLYVDPATRILMGWKKVPGTELEVLLVQKPRIIKLVNIPEKK